MSTVPATTSSNSTSTTSSSTKLNLKTDDFIKLMLTQLQHQDPTSPTKDQDLLNQMSQIGQLQSADATQTSLKTMTETMQNTMAAMLLQQQIGSAGNLIGKSVQGTDASGKSISGLCTSVNVDPSTKAVNLELDNGKTLPLANVASIAQK